MSAYLRITSQLTAHGDDPGVGQPRRRYVDWNRDIADIEVGSPRSEAHVLAAGETLSLFDGSRALAVDGTTELEVELVTGYTDRYRFRHTGGTAPGFRTDRGLDLSGGTVSVVVNPNSTATMTAAGGPDFTGVQVGDILWLPDTTEIVSSPFSASNQGFWVVLTASTTVLVVKREGSFEGYEEAAIAITAADQVQAFSAAGVQAGDSLEVLGGFVASTQRVYPIVAATPSYLEVTATSPIAEESGVTPGAAGLNVYTAAKRFVRVEADQECVVRVNGDSGNTQRVAPWLAGDETKIGLYERHGPTWALSVVNLAPTSLNVTIVSAE